MGVLEQREESLVGNVTGNVRPLKAIHFRSLFYNSDASTLPEYFLGKSW